MTPEPTSLRAVREETIDVLCRHFAEDAMSLGELERRLDRARSARTRSELRQLVDDLKPPAPAAAPAGPTPGRRPAADRARPPARSHDSIPEAASAARYRGGAPSARHSGGQLAFAIMGGTSRTGHWAPPSTMTAVAIMGGVELDFRRAVFSGESVELNCFAFWGSVEIVVPPGVHVDTTGFAVLGGFDQSADLDTRPAPGAPTIRVNGFALMGAVAVEVREPE